MANKKLKKSLKKYDKSKQNKETLISGELGITLGGRRIVEVPGRQGFVYVRLKGNTSELIQAYNATVSPVYDLPVFVVRQTGIYKVVGRNIERHQNQWGTAPFLPKHGGQHSFNHEIGAGGDVVWTYSQQFMPLLSYPSGTQGSMTLSLSPAFYEWEGSWRYAQVTGSPDYTPLLPTITGSARMVLSYLDPVDNSVKLVPGTPFSNLITGAAQIAQYIPDIPRSIGLPLAAVRLVTGTTQISWNAVYDVRDFFTVHVSSGTTSGGASDGFGFVGQDEGVYLATGTVLNVTGAGATLSVSGTVFNLNVPGGGSSFAGVDQIGIYALDDGTPVGTGSTVNFGSNLSVVRTGTTLFVDAIAGGGGGGAGVMAWDEGVPLGTGTVFNFVGSSVEATISGSVVRVSVSGGGGYSEGTSFPVGPSTDDKFYRTDRNLLYYYDGTRWLTTTLYAQTIESQRVVTPLGADNFFETAVWTDDYDQYIVDFRATVYVVGTNNGSAYWNLNLDSLDGGGAASSIATVNTSAISPNAWTRLKVVINALLGTGKDGIEVGFAKTGSPGTLYVSTMFTYRLVG
jgi:hypothetical protein